MLKKVQDYNRERLLLLKRSKLAFLESQLQLQQKQKADSKTIYQTMKDINKVKRELNNN